MPLVFLVLWLFHSSKQADNRKGNTMNTTTKDSRFTFLTLGELPADHVGPVAIKGLYLNHGYYIVNASKIEHNVGTKGLTAVYADCFCDGVELFTPAKQARLHN